MQCLACNFCFYVKHPLAHGSVIAYKKTWGAGVAFRNMPLSYCPFEIGKFAERRLYDFSAHVLVSDSDTANEVKISRPEQMSMGGSDIGLGLHIHGPLILYTHACKPIIDCG